MTIMLVSFSGELSCVKDFSVGVEDTPKGRVGGAVVLNHSTLFLG